MRGMCGMCGMLGDVIVLHVLKAMATLLRFKAFSCGEPAPGFSPSAKDTHQTRGAQALGLAQAPTGA